MDASWGLFGATLMLIGVTAWYAWHTRSIARRTADAADAARDSARAAERSAVAAEAMVRIERERHWDEDRPELHVAMPEMSSISATQSARCTVHVRNNGKGPAEGIDITGVVLTDGSRKDCTPNKRIAESLLPGGLDGLEFGVPATPTADPSYRLIFICHYTDIHGRPGNERLYHSVFDNRVSSAYRTYRPGQELPDLYRQACKLCRTGNTGV